MTKEEALAQRFVYRRVIAFIAFGSLLFVIGFVLIVGGLNAKAAYNFAQLSMLIGGFVSVLAAIVMVYMGVAAYEHGKVKLTN